MKDACLSLDKQIYEIAQENMASEADITVDEVRAFVDYRLSLSEMTFTHPQTLLLILEQVYRAFKINSNETYHK